MLTQARLKYLLDYDADTGIFTWKPSRKNCSGKVAGYFKTGGYRQIEIDGKAHYEHRLAWLYVYGVMPTEDTDHIDHDVANNRISNLRPVSTSENMQNQTKARVDNLSTGILGVHKIKNNEKFVARIGLDGKRIHLGTFNTAEEANLAYLVAKRKYHPASILSQGDVNA